MNQCVNLQNLYSDSNKYILQDIQELHNLKRIYSCFDKYYNDDSCLLKDLLINNKLEYVNINFEQLDRNIMHSITISSNINQLRHLYIINGTDKFSMTLDITNEFP